MRPTPRLLLATAILAGAAVCVTACGEGGDLRRTSADTATPEDGSAGEGTSDDGTAHAPDGCVADSGRAVARYRVVRGDTLRGIALRVYGDAALWREIERANPDVVGRDGVIRAGDELVLPFAGR